MKTYDAPEWMIRAMMETGVRDSDYFLYGAGRALGFMLMAADALDDLGNGFDRPGNPLKEAEYHAYIGISAARTTIDATAGWLNIALEVGLNFNNRINLSRKDFRSKIIETRPETQSPIERLGAFGAKIDKQRQRAQHRDGLVLKYHSGSNSSGHQEGWHLWPEGSEGGFESSVHIAGTLREWAAKIEKNLIEIHQMVLGN